MLYINDDIYIPKQLNDLLSKMLKNIYDINLLSMSFLEVNIVKTLNLVKLLLNNKWPFSINLTGKLTRK